MLEWSEDYSTGLPEVDDQHKRLFQVINQLGVSIAEGKGDEFLERTIDFLSGYVKEHFGYEEECMEKYQCPVAEKNHAAHQVFIKNFEGYRERFHSDPKDNALIMDIHRDCEDWIKDHICSIDVHLRECVHRHQG